MSLRKTDSSDLFRLFKPHREGSETNRGPSLLRQQLPVLSQKKTCGTSKIRLRPSCHTRRASELSEARSEERTCVSRNCSQELNESGAFVRLSRQIQSRHVILYHTNERHRDVHSSEKPAAPPPARGPPPDTEFGVRGDTSKRT